MAEKLKFYRTRDFSGGINSLDAEHAIAGNEAVIALNVLVGNGYVESRNGLTLWNEHDTRTGGITMMCPMYMRDGSTKELFFSNDDDYFTLPSTTTTATSWTTISDYGTVVNNPFAVQYQNQLFLGTGITANTQSRWDGAGAITAVGTPADASGDLRFAEYHQGQNIAYLLGAGNVRDNVSHNDSILYYTLDVDDWSGGGTLGIGTSDGQKLTAVKSHSNILAYKNNSMYRLDIVYESNSGTHVMRVLERFQDIGAINHEVCQISVNDCISLSQRHGVRGSQQVQTQLGGSESRRLSTKIKPLLDTIDWDTAKTTARAIVWDEKYFISVPLGGSATNNAVFVGFLDSVTANGEIPWTLFNINAGSFAIFQDSNGLDRLMIGDSNEPKIYIWDKDALSDNQSNITTQYRTGRLDMGDLEVDEFQDIILSGLMTELTELKITVYVDGLSTSYLITKDQILNTPAYIWSHVIGSEIVGGTSTDATKPRWLAILSLPDSHRVGSEIQVEFSSVGQGYYWRVDYLSINEPINTNLYPEAHEVSEEG